MAKALERERERERERVPVDGLSRFMPATMYTKRVTGSTFTSSDVTFI
jgi:hypothetical protein